jgi:hypothetical protein
MPWKDDWVEIPKGFSMKDAVTKEFDYKQYLTGNYYVFTKGNIEKNIGTGTLGVYEQVEIWNEKTTYELFESDGKTYNVDSYDVYGKMRFSSTSFTDESSHDDDDREETDCWDYKGRYTTESDRKDSRSMDEIYAKYGDSLDLILVHKKSIDNFKEIKQSNMIVGPAKRFYNVYYCNKNKHMIISKLPGDDDPVKLISDVENTDFSGSSLTYIATIDICELPSVREMMISKNLFTIKE